MSETNLFPHQVIFIRVSLFQTSESFLLADEKALRELILIDSNESHTGEHWNVDDIRTIVTAKHLCSCGDPIVMSFKVTTTIITLTLHL